MNSSEKLEYEKLAGYYGTLDESGNIIDEYYRELYQQRMLRNRQGIDSYRLNEPLQTGFSQSHNIFAEGGDAAFRYGIGMTYTHTNGVMKNSSRDILNGNVQLTYRIDKFAFTNQTNITNTDVENPTVSFSEFARTNPFYDKYNEYGEVEQVMEEVRSATSGTQYITNPLWDFNQNSYDKSNQLAFVNNFQIEYRPISELRIRGKFGITVGRNNAEVFNSPEMSEYLTTETLKKEATKKPTRSLHPTTEVSTYPTERPSANIQSMSSAVCRSVKTDRTCLFSRQSDIPVTCSPTRTSRTDIRKAENRVPLSPRSDMPAIMPTSTTDTTCAIW